MSYYASKDCMKMLIVMIFCIAFSLYYQEVVMCLKSPS
jgi:hypothetical protein